MRTPVRNFMPVVYPPKPQTCMTRQGTRHVGASLAVEVVAQLLAVLGVPELGQRLGLDLADALTGHAELTTDLLERAGLAVVEAEPHPDDGLLAVVEIGERLLDRR